MTIKFSAGDVIHQKRDNIVYLIEKVSRGKITVGFYSRINERWQSMVITKKELMNEFSTRGDLLDIVPAKKREKKQRKRDG